MTPRGVSCVCVSVPPPAICGSSPGLPTPPTPPPDTPITAPPPRDPPQEPPTEEGAAAEDGAAGATEDADEKV